MRTTILTKLKSMAAGLVLTLFVAAPVWADDTEIFFGGTNSNTGIRPNILFILDTSESMNDKDGGASTRLDRMKDALRSMINSVNNVNIGLMRFNNPGGPVLFPVAYIDDDVSKYESGSAAGNQVSVRVSSSSDDAEENSAGAVDVTSKNLQMTTDPGHSGSTTTTIEVSIASGSDDAEERSDASVLLGSDDLEMVYQPGFTGPQILGLRFQNVNIPAGATIVNAELEFKVDEPGKGTISVDIVGEAADSALTYTSTSNNVSSRSKTTAVVDWNDVPGAAVDGTIRTPNLKNIVQEIVNRAGWLSGNSMAFMIYKDPSATSDADNWRTYEAYEGSRAPKLRITYTTGVGLTDTSQVVGLRFQNINIPQGATITSAKLVFESDQTNNESTSLSIYGEAADNSATFTTAANNITGRSFTTASVNWAAIPGWNLPDVQHNSPDIRAVVQEIVNRSGWCGGNAMSFLIKGTGQRTAKSFDGSTGSAPKLVITYDTSSLTTGQGCVSKTYVRQVSTGADDGEESNSGNVNLSSGTIEIPKSSGQQTVGFRFRNIPIPAGSTIVSANLQLTVNSTPNSQSMAFDINAHAHDDAPDFTTNKNDLTSRTKTGATATWSWSATDAPAVGVKVQSPDLAAVVQEVVSRSGWVSGNDLAFIIDRQSGNGYRVFESYDNAPTKAATLTVKVKWNVGDNPSAGIKTVRNRLIEIVNDMSYGDYTPIVDTMLEAAAYFRGEAVTFGKNRGGTLALNKQNNRVSHPASYTGGTVVRDSACTDADLNSTACKTEYIDGSPKYVSPITDTCQRNYIVFLSDGDPTVNTVASAVQSKIGSSCADTGFFACGPELAKWLFEKDHSSVLADKQNVITHTIGFNFSSTWFKNIATEGGGQFYTAASAADLSNVFNAIIQNVLKIDTTFVSPGAAVNQFNRLTHRDEIYFSVFKPSDKPYWNGNLKRYKVDGFPPIVMDANSVGAVDNTTGFFKSTARSFWSTTTDGNDVTAGGYVSNLSLTGRKVFTYTGDGTTNLTLSLAANALDENNANITKAMLGIDLETDAYRTSLLQWGRGVDVKDFDGDGNVTELRRQIGDPLHSRPVIVTYGGTSDNPDTTVFFATNEGFLYAVSGETGKEHFAFIPKELLPNLNKYYVNTTTTRPYGLDGSVTVWVNDVDKDNQIEPADGDFVYIYVGMRRGGRNYYAIDVTDRANPKLMWTIRNTDTGFGEMGQTWSAPVKAKVRIGNGTSATVHDVIIFAGGYDPDQDTHTTRTVDSEGRAIFMVDAKTGAKLWSAGLSGHSLNLADMKYSIPSTIRVIDTNGDYLADQMWVGDMGGQLWRFDIANGATNFGGLVTGGVVMNIGVDADVNQNRRFYYQPDVSLLKKDGALVLNVAIGTGWRAHPLDLNIQDRFYNITTTDIYSAPASYTAVTEANLYDATLNLIGQGTETEKTTALADLKTKIGWFLKLEQTGEKVLAQSVTINNQIIFTTYIPNAVTTGCQAAQGGGRTYLINAADATPVLNLDHIGDPSSLTKSDRYVKLTRGGIPPTPTPFFPDNGAGPIVLIGPERGPNVNFGNLTGRTYWYEKTN